jgi:hypothetical protein
MRSLIRKTRQMLRRWLKMDPEPPLDPYAWVGAPKKPRPPQRSASATAVVDDL